MQGAMPCCSLTLMCHLFTNVLHMTTIQMEANTARLVGDELLAYINGNESSMSKTQQCLGAGYVKYIDGIGYPQFTDFYTAILEARGIERDIKDAERKVECSTWYDNLTEQDQELYDMIEDRCPEFLKLNGELCREFMDELSKYGITTAEQFEDAYFTQLSYAYDESHFGEFVEYMITEVLCQELPEYLVIDWQASWYRNYQHDFFSIEFDGEVYFFSTHF